MNPGGQHLAHFNWATLIGDLGSPEVAGFENSIDKVNAIAARSPGFVWRDEQEMEHVRRIGWPLFDDNHRTIASFSVWESPKAFREFVHQTVHGAFFRRREEWFEPGKGVNYVLWWVPEEHRPTATEARQKVERLLAVGPSPEAFDLSFCGADE